MVSVSVVVSVAVVAVAVAVAVAAPVLALGLIHFLLQQQPLVQSQTLLPHK